MMRTWAGRYAADVRGTRAHASIAPGRSPARARTRARPNAAEVNDGSVRETTSNMRADLVGSIVSVARASTSLGASSPGTAP